MKIIFRNSELNKGLINVSLDGGFTFTDYEIADVKETGILLDDSQDYEKIKIKGPANTLKRLDVITTIPSNGDNSEGFNFIIDKDTYGLSFPECIVGITLPDGITSITKSFTSSYSTENGFYNFPNLHTIVIPSSVLSIGDYAFYDCSNITSISISEGVTEIGNSTFSGCSSLTSINIPNSVTSIGKEAFRNCSSLTSVTIQDGVTSIGIGAFYNCTKLTSIDIPSSVKSINQYVFQGCSSLTNVNIPSSVTTIGSSTFYGCSSLTSIIIDENNQNYSTSEDKKVLFNKDKTTLICYPSANGDYTIPNSVTKIDNYAFYNCSSLTSIDVPSSVTFIGEYAFYNCSGLTSIDIPSSVTSIGKSAFARCSNLTSIDIPESVTSIGNYAFQSCSKLTSINYTGTEEQWNAISKGDNWNKNCPSMVINYNYQG